MGRTYTTIQGDTWDSISYKMYGREKFMGILMQANLDLIETFVFSAGTVLTVPELGNGVIQNTPSWRQ